MKDQISDEQLDTKLRLLLKQSVADDALVNDIAGSPTLWWNIQRQINEQAADHRSPWPPVNKWLRWLAIGIPAIAAVALLVSFIVFRHAAPSNAVAALEPVPESIAGANVELTQPTSEQTAPLAIAPTIIAAKTTSHRAVREQARTIGPRTEQKTLPISKPANEIKTEFIALSYARDPESGQLVRVKVPSSMMVSLGVVTSVKRPADLVDAEVLLGDDGLTRAIRFIRTN